MVAIRQASVGERGGRCVGRRHGRRFSGFTLIELLVSIGIIAVLLSILTPVLMMARASARDARCLSNLHQTGLGWEMFFQTHRFFPGNPDERTERGPLMFDWAGVDWFASEVDRRFSPNRPLNPYIGADLDERARAEVFQCPRDDGWKVMDYRGNTTRYEFQLADAERTDLVSLSGAEDRGENLFGVMGNSYRCNEWMWAKVGDPDGFTSRTNGVVVNNGPINVKYPERFVLVGDCGPFLAGRYDPSKRLGTQLPAQYEGILPTPGGVVFGWWHGFEVCNMAFMDGSARRIKMTPGTAATNEYTFWLDPDQHGPESSVYGQGVRRTGRPPMPTPPATP